jgi:hypothetical protein
LHHIEQILHDLEQHLQGQSRDVAENIREITTLAERLAELDRQNKGES